jgi:two-component system, NarL family, nitrate/nitrite response regulator NarL
VFLIGAISSEVRQHSQVTAARLLIVDDHRVFADSLSAALAMNGFDVVGVASDGRSAVESAETHDPDVVVCDLRMPGAQGVSVLVSLVGLNGPRVVVLSASADERSVGDALEAGCSGYLTKDQPLSEVVAALQQVLDGGTYIPPHLLSAVMTRLRRGRSIEAELTAREHDVLALIAQGATNQAVADELSISVNTVRNHVGNVLVKLDAHSKLEAVVAAQRLGLL